MPHSPSAEHRHFVIQATKSIVPAELTRKQDFGNVGLSRYGPN
jgi:hypothetical protein